MGSSVFVFCGILLLFLWQCLNIAQTKTGVSFRGNQANSGRCTKKMGKDDVCIENNYYFCKRTTHIDHLNSYAYEIRNN